MTTNQTIGNGAWHNVVLTFDGNSTVNNYQFYYDGVLKAQKSIAAGQALALSGSLLLGKGQGSGAGQNWNGLIDSVAVFNNVESVASLFAGTNVALVGNWTGTGNGNWSTTDNWQGGTLPAASRPIVFDTANTTNNNDFASGTTYKGITFNSGAGAFTLNGNSVVLTGDLVNNSTNTQTISLAALTLSGGTRTFNTATGNFTVSSPIHQVAATGLTKIGSGTLTLSATGANDYDYTGATNVNNGRLHLAGAKLSGSSLTVSGVSSTLSGNGTMTQAALIQSSARLAPGSSPSTVGQFDFQGGLTLDTAVLDVKLGAPNAISNLATDSDVINVTGNLTLNGSTTLNVSQLAGFAYGDYNFLNFTGSLLGSGSILAPTNTSQYGYRIITNPNDLLLHVYLPPSSKTWAGQVAGNDDANWNIMTTSNWLSGATAVTYNESVDGNDPVIFSDSATGTTAVALNTTVAPFSVTFANNVKSYSVSGSGSIVGTASFTVSGGGGVVLNTANTFTGDTVVSAGTLTLGHTNALAGSTLNYNNSGGTLSFGSLLTVNLGGLKQGQNILLNNNGSGAVSLAVGGNGQNTQYDGVLSGDGSFTKNGPGTLTLTASETYLGATTVNSGTLVATNLSGTSGINVLGGILSLQSYNPAATLAVSNGASASVSGTGLSLAAVSNNGILNFTGNSGTITLAGLSGAAGTTVFSAGAGIPTLSEGVITVAGVATIGVANGGTANLNGATASITTLNDAAVVLGASTVLTVSDGTQTTRSVTGGGGIVKISSGILTLNTPTNSGGITINEGTVSTNSVPSGAVTFNGGIWQFTGVTGTKDLNTASSGNFKIDVTTGNLFVTRNGGNYNTTVMMGLGTLTLANAGLQDGGNLQVDSGTVVLAGTPSIGQGYANVSSVADVKPGATLKLNNASGGQVYFDFAFHMSGGAFDVNGQNPNAAQNTSVPAIDGTGTITNSALNAGTAVFKINGNKTFAGTIADGNGRVGVTLAAGAGTWTLTSANTHSGNTRINSGILKLDNNLALQNSTFDTGGGGRMTLTVTTPTFGGLTGGNALATVINTGYTNVSALTLNPGAGFTNTYTGVIADGAAGMTLTKTGAGTQILSGINTYTGLTTISAGTLAYGANDVIATGPVTVNGATAVLDLGASHNDTVGTVTLEGGGSITGTGTSTLTSTGTFEMKSGTVSASLGGSGIPLNKTTSSTVTLSGTNGTYDGLTTVSEGTLALGASNALGAGGVIVTGATSVLDLGLDHTDSVGTVTLDGGTISGTGLSALTSTGTFEMKSGLVSTVLAGAGTGFNKSTGGIVTLVGLNTYTGATLVNEGTLVVNGSISGSTTTVNATATLAGKDGILGSVIANTGGVFSPGGSTIGSLTVNGDLNLNNASILSIQFDSDVADVDKITLNGNLNIASGAILDLSDNGLNPSSILGLQAAIITYSGPWNGTTFAGLADDSVFVRGDIAYQISYNEVNPDSLTGGVVTLTMLAVVPEPGAAVSLLGGLGLLLGVRRRRV